MKFPGVFDAGRLRSSQESSIDVENAASTCGIDDHGNKCSLGNETETYETDMGALEALNRTFESDMGVALAKRLTSFCERPSEWHESDTQSCGRPAASASNESFANQSPEKASIQTMLDESAPSAASTQVLSSDHLASAQSSSSHAVLSTTLDSICSNHVNEVSQESNQLISQHADAFRDDISFAAKEIANHASAESSSRGIKKLRRTSDHLETQECTEFIQSDTYDISSGERIGVSTPSSLVSKPTNEKLDEKLAVRIGTSTTMITAEASVDACRALEKRSLLDAPTDASARPTKRARPENPHIVRSGTSVIRSSIGHSLAPPEQGTKVTVHGDGWGSGEGDYTAIVTEADPHTFTVVADSGPHAWTETHVLREYCTALT